VLQITLPLIAAIFGASWLQKSERHGSRRLSALE
jgi:hypothetical protein